MSQQYLIYRGGPRPPFETVGWVATESLVELAAKLRVELARLNDCLNNGVSFGKQLDPNNPRRYHLYYVASIPEIKGTWPFS